MTKPSKIPSISADQAKAILHFLQRASLQGSEMPAYVDVVNSLSQVAGIVPSAPERNVPENAQ